MVFEIMPLKQEKQSREIIVLLMLGAITLAYGYYYNTHKYTASLVNFIFHMLNIR
jgi:hypothetical protein